MTDGRANLSLASEARRAPRGECWPHGGQPQPSATARAGGRWGGAGSLPLLRWGSPPGQENHELGGEPEPQHQHLAQPRAPMPMHCSGLQHGEAPREPRPPGQPHLGGPSHLPACQSPRLPLTSSAAAAAFKTRLPLAFLSPAQLWRGEGGHRRGTSGLHCSLSGN